MTDRLCIFAKAPRPGAVKTRLCPPLTHEQAAAVHEASLLDVLANARAAGTPITLFHDPAPGSAAYFQGVSSGEPIVAQQGEDLGARLASAFELCFGQGSDRVVILGADSPTLPRHILDDGFAQLAIAPAVLGPAEDGGYYLIGLRRTEWSRTSILLQDIPWSTGRVLEITLQTAATAGITVAMLPLWYDVDRPEDLRRARLDTSPDSHLAALLHAAPGILSPR